jgi:hypothetical protein
MRLLPFVLLSACLLGCGARRVNGPAGSQGRTTTGEWMPEFNDLTREAWIGQPVRLGAQRGKVVLVEFWTFG